MDVFESMTHTQHALLSERIEKLAQALSNGVYEREHTMKLCLLAALCGESVFLLGPPGIAKSMIAKRLIQGFEDQDYFEYLMTRFSTPEEVFGPLSIHDLKDNGRYTRLTQGYLPSAHVVFLDEIWKAGPAILNTLLTVVNEKTFKNGQETQPVPMRLLITASNELPDKDSGLDALYDRLLIRLFVDRIQSKQNFQAMLTQGTELESKVDDVLKISRQESLQWQQALEKVSLPSDMFDALYQLKESLEQLQAREPANSQALYVSDRRWKKAVKLLKASAFFNGRQAVNGLDLLLLEHCLWNTPQSKEQVQNLIYQFATRQAYGQQDIDGELAVIGEKATQLQQQLVQSLQLQTRASVQSGLRRKTQFDVSWHQAASFKVGYQNHVHKFLILKPDTKVSEQYQSESRWVYVAHDDIDKALKEGGAEVMGFVNDHKELTKLTFRVEEQGQVVLKDVANRSVPVALVEQSASAQLQAIETAQQAMVALGQARSSLQAKLDQAKRDFHHALPHIFVESHLLMAIEADFQSMTQRLDALQTQLDEGEQSCVSYHHYFSESR
ncbi:MULTISPECIES: ATPase RavA domain-containing protein [unclassified Vibrio]|uniref:ATPase RavA domain-containing protein n=1 Tax=Vibrio sp. HB236076 TaxID=3232307 RepID=A0AB39HJN6_9VIBR|nr:ATPase RavA domain-containing protein [Vibrio sp. HB161653]MDP5253113.1 DUF3763 domain-containing protein [Vibrio sp. HB161653]